MFPPLLNPVEPPWYGPVCQVVWEGRHREASPYPDQSTFALLALIRPQGLSRLPELDQRIPIVIPSLH